MCVLCIVCCVLGVRLAWSSLPYGYSIAVRVPLITTGMCHKVERGLDPK